MSQQHDKMAANPGDSALPADAPMLACPACGMAARRLRARFCSTCGRQLAHDSYLPADSLLSSYHRQRLSAAPSPSRKQSPARETHAHASSHRSLLFARSQRNAATATAFAFVTYSLVPYLGILFSPGAIMASAIAFTHTRRAAHKINGNSSRGGRTAAYSLILALTIFAAQLFLWWILYKVPEWTKP